MADNFINIIRLNKNGPASLVQQLTAQMRKMIVSGQLPEGFALPSSRHLAKTLGISRNTVTSAIDQLTAEGFLVTSQGRRPTVAAAFTRPKSSRAIGSRQHSRPPNLSLWASHIRADSWPPQNEKRPLPFRPGVSDERLFPHDIWARCLRRASRAQSALSDRALNHPPLRAALRNHLATHRGTRSDAERIFIVPTAQTGFALIAKLIVNPGDLCWVESPGYGGAIAALNATGAKIKGIPLDRQGLVLDPRQPAPKLIFTTPAHQNPTGRLMSIGRRLDLIRFAAANDAWIIEDDYDGEYHYEGNPIPSLQGLDENNRTFYVGTFSKSTCADIRLGYVIVPPTLVDVFGKAQRHFGALAPRYMQIALAEFMRDGHYLAHVRRTRRIYHARRDCLADAVERHLPELLSVEIPAGGMQLVAWINGAADDTATSICLQNAGITTRAISPMFSCGARRDGLFLGFAGWNEREIEKTVRKMANAIG